MNTPVTPPPNHKPGDSISFVRAVLGVALVVTLVILVFFGIGFFVGRIIL